jgi:hypothetical protein
VQRDEKRALHGPRADPLNLGEPPDHLVIGQLAQLGLGQAPIAEALRQIQDGCSFVPGQSEAMQCPLVEGRELASIRPLAWLAMAQPDLKCSGSAAALRRGSPPCESLREEGPPHIVDQLDSRDSLTGVHDQVSEHGSLPWAAERK